MSNGERDSAVEKTSRAAASKADGGWKGLLARVLVAQFGHPRGRWGELAGWIMAHRPSNVERNLWTVGLLGLEPTDRVLEIGFGPGVAIAEASRRVPDGVVVGLDQSEVMLRQATRRNRTAIEEGRVRLLAGSVTDLPTPEQPFDKVFAVNSVTFWPEPVEQLRALRAMLPPGGVLALTEQPRSRGADETTARQAAQRISRQLEKAGFENVRIEMREMKPAPAVCVVARC